MLSMSEVVKMHRNIEKWLDNGLDERQYRLILQDIERRKQIREREALSIWLLAAFSTYYAGIQGKSTKMYAKIAADSYEALKNDGGIT